MSTENSATTKIEFNHVSNDENESGYGLTYVIRKDAAYALSTVKGFVAREAQEFTPQEIDNALHNAYATWGHNVLETMAECIDYDLYKIDKPEDRTVNVHFYNARDLHTKAFKIAEQCVWDNYDQQPAFCISFDEMITETHKATTDIGFSRQFGLDGTQLSGFVARPGKDGLEQQILHVMEQLEAVRHHYTAKIPVVLMEDNVRHAKTLNWIIEKMDSMGVFERAQLAAIATCFCSASPKEQQAIQHHGRVIPLQSVVEYQGTKVDVTTPRDLLFDGAVVDVKGTMGRLPVLFMDVKKQMKICPAKVDDFRQRVATINADFCDNVSQSLCVDLPVSAFAGGRAITALMGFHPQMPMKEVLQETCFTPSPSGSIVLDYARGIRGKAIRNDNTYDPS